MSSNIECLFGFHTPMRWKPNKECTTSRKVRYYPVKQCRYCRKIIEKCPCVYYGSNLHSLVNYCERLNRQDRINERLRDKN